MKRLRNIKIYRTLIQIIFFFLFPGFITLAFIQIKLFLDNLISGNIIQIFSDCLVLLVLLILTILVGRLFCGWMCIFGSFNDWINILGRNILKIKYNINPKLDKYLKYIKYLILLIFITLVWTSIITLPKGSSPWDAFTQLIDPKYLLSNYLIGFILLIGITIGALFIERFFCRYLCPLGALFALAERFKIVKIHKDRSNCGPCKICTLKCSMGIDLDSVDVVKSGECIQCYNCIAVCPKDNARLKMNDKVVNGYAVATISLAATSGIYLGLEAINNNLNNDSNQNINNPNNNNEVNNYKYKDGTYIGVGRGYRSNLKLSVTIKNDKITSIEVYSSNETSNYFSRAWSRVKNDIINSQSTAVDTVSGATRSSEGIMEAVTDALSQAEAANNSGSTNDNNINDNSNTNINDINDYEDDDENDTDRYEDEDYENEETDYYDYEEETKDEPINVKYKDGTYIGIGRGYRPYLQLEVTIKDNKITSIEVYSSNETPNYLARAWSSVKNDIIDSQSTDVDTVSGATRSSEGIMEAIDDALRQASI